MQRKKGHILRCGQYFQSFLKLFQIRYQEPNYRTNTQFSIIRRFLSGLVTNYKLIGAFLPNRVIIHKIHYAGNTMVCMEYVVSLRTHFYRIRRLLVQ